MPTGSALRRKAAPLFAFAAISCGFDPVVRPLKPQKLSDEPAQVLGTLDARGEYLLLAHSTEDGAKVASIRAWRKREECDVPVLGEPLASPLERPAKGKGPLLYVPVAVAGSEDTSELVLIDETCTQYGPLGALVPRTARSYTSRVDDHTFLVFRSPENTLWLLDPYTSLRPREIARDVQLTRPGLAPGKPPRDALWLLEAGRLTQRALDGTLLRTLGDEVDSMVLDSAAERVAFAQAGELYEATAPDFKPKRLAQNACSPRYSRTDLEFFSPCAEQALVRIRLSTGRATRFEPGVFASSIQEGVQLDYVHGDEADQLIAQFPDGERIEVEPTLTQGETYVLDEERIAGVDESQRFGVWSRQGEVFSVLFDSVAQVVPHHRGKTHTYGWLVYHDVEHGLGTLSLLEQKGMLRSPVAQGVPASSLQGYLVENGDSFPHYPFAAPLVVVLEQAAPLAEEGRYRGRLKVLAMTGEPDQVLADAVSSYALVAAPVPGVVYAVDEGETRGLWYAPF